MNRLDLPRKILKNKFILYPYIIGMYAIVITLTANVIDISPKQSLRSVLFVFVITTLILFIGIKTIRNLHRATLISFISVFLIFSYGRFFRLLNNNQILGLSITQHYLLLPFLIIISTVIIISYFRLSSIKAERFSNVLLLITTFALLISLFQLVYIYIRIGKNPFESLIKENDITIELDTYIKDKPETLPDIYYLILDGYGREDTLKEIYGFDNSEFLDFLEDREFYIADKSRTNYLQTALSLAASLNFEYIPNLRNQGSNSVNPKPIIEHIRHSKIRSILEQHGYKFITFDSGYPFTEINDAFSYNSPFIEINDFEELFITHSIAIILDNLEKNPFPFYTYNTHRSRVLYTFEQLKNIPQIPGPKFVFVHLLIPHPPFTFDRNGNPVTPDRAYEIHDANLFKGSKDEYMEGYIKQVKFTNHQIKIIIDNILISTRPPPIIVIQGDHGPKMLMDWEAIEDSCLKEASSILNAYYLPGLRPDWLYPSITPVNTFRIILNHYFNSNLNLIEDKTYISETIRPDKFVDVTEGAESSCFDIGEK